MKKLFLLLSLFLVFGCESKISKQSEQIDIAAVKEKFEDEFKGSYPDEIVPTGKIVEYEIEAKERSFALIGEKQTKTWGYSETAAPLELRVKLGDTLKVDFKNSLPDETTIHWHGVRVPNAMDGVPGVNQDPIEPGDSFVYEFTPKDAGTFWFHPHVRGSEQLERGLKGVLIVEEPEPIGFTKDVTWVLDDWFLTSDLKIRPTFNTSHELMHDGRWGNVITINGKQKEELNVQVGDRIRLRLIDVANARMFKPLLGDLSAMVFANDGMFVATPFAYETTILAPGNRLDLDIKITPDMAGKTFPIKNDFYSTDVLGFINVSNELLDTPLPNFETPKAEKFPAWKDIQKLPNDEIFELNAKRKMIIKDGRTQNTIAWTINGKTFSEAGKVGLKKNELTIVEYKNLSSRLHPMHLHGQFFRVISRNGEEISENFWRDTLLVGPRETIKVALMPTDTGTWAHHCHILEHAESGMMNLIEVKE